MHNEQDKKKLKKQSTLRRVTNIDPEEAEIPQNAWKTARRLWEAAKGERWRIVVRLFRPRG